MFRREGQFIEPQAELAASEAAALIGELSSVSDKTGNHLKFKEVGLNGDLNKLMETTNIRAEIAKDLSENDLELMRKVVGILTHFITSPIFTDKFGLDHASRQTWEKQSGLRENRSNSQISDSAKIYYHANRLGFNRCSAAIGLMLNIADNIINPDLKIRFQELTKNIPREFLEKDENDIFQYHNLEDADKIRVVEELSRIVKEAIFFLKA